MNTMSKKIKALIVAAIVLASGLAGAAIYKVTVGPVEVTKLVEVKVPGPVSVVEKNVTVEKIVPGPTVIVEKNITVVDESFKQLACERLLYDDMAQCVVEVKAENEALGLALDQLKKDFGDELAHADLVDRAKDASIVRVYDSFEDLTISNSDYDRSEYEFVIRAKISDKEAEEKFFVNFTVTVEDGEAEVVDVALDN